MSLYGALLHLYPSSFRAEYGGEMRAIFRERRKEAGNAGSVLMLWLDAIAELIVNAAKVHADILRQDLVYTARTLSRSPGFAFTAIAVTALGIGANTAAFSVADFVLLRPLPYKDADRLVKLWEGPEEGGPGGRNEISPAIYREWKSSASSFQAMGALFRSSVNLVGTGEPVRLETAVVTHDLLPILGIQPIKGRTFGPDDERDGTSTVISYGLWQSQFGGDQAIVGRQILVDGSPRIIIGVMPADFHYPVREVALWTPMNAEQQSDPDVTNTYWYVLARLKAGASPEQAAAEANTIAARMRQAHPAELEHIGFAVDGMRDDFARSARFLLYALCGAAGCVLLIACANLANLLLARSLTRRRELLVRSALGAGRERLVRQSVTESCVLALLGGMLGVFVAVVSLPALTKLIPNTLPIAETPSIDPRLVLLAALLTLVTGVAFGVLPAWRSAGESDLSGMRDGARAGGGRRERARSVLVITEVMASVILLVSAGLLMRALLRIQDVDPGFRTGNVHTLRTVLPSPRFDSTSRRTEFYRAVLTEVRAIPGVESAGYGTGLPMVMTGGIWKVEPEGEAASAHIERASSRFITPGYLTSLSVPLRAGRDVGEDDDASHPPIAVVSQSFVKKFFPAGDPIGRRFKFQSNPFTIVGVVGDVRVRGLERTSEPQVYLSYKQMQDGPMQFFTPKDLVVHSKLPLATLIPSVRRIIQGVEPQQPLSDIRMMSDIVAEGTAARTVQVRVLGAFACIAFLLAAVGIHGLLSYSVSSRQHEIGVRMALGAQRGEIVNLIMRKGLLLAIAGVIPGLAVAYAAGRAMQSLLAGVDPADAMTFGVVGILCALMTLIGCLAPTLRAVRVDPATAFRAEV